MMTNLKAKSSETKRTIDQKPKQWYQCGQWFCQLRGVIGKGSTRKKSWLDLYRQLNEE